MRLPRPHRPHLPPLWRESRGAFELAALLRDPVYRRPPAGAGGRVLLVPGFLAGDDSLTLLAGWLRRGGYAPVSAHIRANVGCATEAVGALEALLEERADGGRVSVVGHSYGGVLARTLAARRPDLVRGVVALGSPLVDQLAIHPLARVPVGVVARLGSVGARGLFRRECLTGGCCSEVWESAHRPFPADVGFVSVYSHTDGLVDWRACLDPRARAVEVDASHIGMVVSVPAYRAVAGALREFAAPPARRRTRLALAG